MKMERIIQGTLGALATAAVFGVSAQTAPQSSITTSPAPGATTSGTSQGTMGTQSQGSMNTRSQGGAMGQQPVPTSSSQSGENATRMPHPPTGTGDATGVPGQPGATRSGQNMNAGSEPGRSGMHGSQAAAGRRTHRMQHPPTIRDDAADRMKQQSAMGSQSHGATGQTDGMRREPAIRDDAADRMKQQGATHSGSHGTAGRMQDGTRTSGSQ